MTPKLSTILAQLRAWRAQGAALEAQLEELAAAGDDAATDLGEAELVPRYFKSGRVLRETLRSGELVGARAGRAIIVRRADLDAYLEAKRAKPKAPQASSAKGDDEDALSRAGLRLVGR